MGQWIGLYVGNKKGHIREGMRPEKSRYRRFPTLVLSRSGTRVVQYGLDISAKTLP
jgi:hypothetical protein